MIFNGWATFGYKKLGMAGNFSFPFMHEAKVYFLPAERQVYTDLSVTP